MRRAPRVLFAAILLALISVAPAAAAPASQEGAIVHAVLFYSPTCGHCEYVITEVLPPLLERYGAQLNIIGVDVTNPAAQALFSAAIDFYEIPEDIAGSVPLLTVGDAWLMGSRDIPEQFPGIIEAGLAQGGIDWPAIPGLAEALASVPPDDTSPTTTPAAAEPSTAVPPTASAPLSIPTPAPRTLATTFLNDPAGNTLAVIVLAGMIASAVVVGLRLRNPKPHIVSTRTQVGVVALTLVGVGISVYMTFIETTGTRAVCGPVGDCNTVQQSQFALLFGVIPLGSLGLAGYAAILLAWFAGRSLKGRNADWATVLAFGLCAFGTLFSIVLTFLEPFVIGATCTWCISSALAMTGLLWLTSGPGVAALRQLEGEDEPGPETGEEPAPG
jgi:uncharacterized membrane protein